jgi:ribonuclease BN (tRNA processing enzyme)
MQSNRRQFLAALGSFAATLQAAPSFRIILLGTKGGPLVAKGRSNPATLLLINDVAYVVDCGYGVSRQLLSAGVTLDQLRYIFITHHHPITISSWVRFSTTRGSRPSRQESMYMARPNCNE